MRAASIPDVPHFIFDHEAPPAWTGPVVRRDPDVVRQPSVQLTWRCSNRHCRQFTMNGAHATGRCNFCQTPRS
jgi:hypothetical protein